MFPQQRQHGVGPEKAAIAGKVEGPPSIKTLAVSQYIMLFIGCI
jgi:hypothetical protein